MFRTYRGEEIVRTVPIEIPANASGALSLLVSDGNRLGMNEQREARAPQPRSVDQIIRTLNKGRRNTSLYVKLLGSDAGAVVNGELLAALPPSVLGVLEGDRNGSNPFVHLHVASGYSMQYGASHPHVLVERAAEQEMDTLALTDRDGTYGAVKHAQACRAAGHPPGARRRPGGRSGWSRAAPAPASGPALPHPGARRRVPRRPGAAPGDLPGRRRRRRWPGRAGRRSAGWSRRPS